MKKIINNFIKDVKVELDDEFDLNFDNESNGLIAAVYPAFWCVGQLFTGKMFNHFSKKKMIFWGKFLQGFAILFFPFTSAFLFLLIISALLGLGTALAYPTFLITIAQVKSPKQHAESITAAIFMIAAITITSAL